MTLPAVPLGISLAFRKHTKKRQAWLFITFISIAYIFLSALMYRMIAYAMLCALIPISYGISHFYIFIKNNTGRSYYRFVRTCFILICCYAFVAPNMLFSSKDQGYLVYDKKFLSQICQYLNNDQLLKNTPKRILTSIYLGPLLLCKTHHEVIGTPSHRNTSGILDTYHFMNAKKQDDAHMIVQQRGIQVIIIGRPECGICDYFIDISNNAEESDNIFHHQLWKGNIPAWLQAYPTPKSLEGKIKVFKVKE